MATLYTVGERLIVSGLQWQLLDDVQTGKKKTPNKPALKEALLAKRTNALMICGSEQYQVRGILTKDAFTSMGKVPLFAKLYSLADIFSNYPDLPTCAILALPLPEQPDLYAMCVVINGAPIAANGYDTIVARDKVGETIASWVFNFSEEHGVKARVYGVYTDAFELTFDELLEKADGARPMRRLSMDKRIVVPIVTAVCLAVGGVYGYQVIQKQKAIKEANARKIKQDPIRLYNAALDKQWPEIQWGTAQRVRAAIEQAGRVPADLGGFSIAGDVNCDILTGTCALTYKMKDGTYDTFVAAAANRVTVTSFGQDGKTVTATLVLKDLPPLRAPGSKDELPAEDNLPKLFWTPMQAYPISVVAPVFTPNYELFPKVPGISEAVLPKKVRVVPVEVTFPLWGYKDMPPNTPVFNNSISWKSVTIRMNLGVTVKGDMYAQK